jgi:segregation and condensation protein A
MSGSEPATAPAAQEAAPQEAGPQEAGPQEAGPQEAGPDALILRLDGFEGPLDLLLDLARAQKVDLGRISILALVEQYLAVIEGARRVRLELAADWLVMAAWLTWLKSRLLLPEDDPAAEDGEIAAETLAERLAELEAMRAAAAWLGARPQLGRDTKLRLDMPALLAAYLAARRRAAGKARYRPRPVDYWTVQKALERVRRMLGGMPGWAELARFLPESREASAEAGPLAQRAALASTLLAGLELARSGACALRQEQQFGPILIRAAEAPPRSAAEPS